MEETASLAAAVLTTAAAVMVAVNYGPRLTGAGFIVFALGSIAWMVVAVVTDQPGLLWQNVALLVINLFGVWRWLGLRARYAKGASAATKVSE
jgi:hypothetical protein